MNERTDALIRPRNGILSAAADFMRRQDRDWKVTMARTSVDKFAYQMPAGRAAPSR